MTFQVLLDVVAREAELAPHPIRRQLPFADHAPYRDDIDPKELGDIFGSKQGFHYDLRIYENRKYYTVL